MCALMSTGHIWTPGLGLARHASGLTPVSRLTKWHSVALAPGVTLSDTGWAWTGPRPEVRDLAEKLTGRFIADCEIPSEKTPAAKLPQYWRGLPGEVEIAEHLARHALGVTSHGFPKREMRETLSVFARAGLPVFPQVYDNDRSTARNPGGSETFLRDCVSMHRDLGFENVVPILGLKAGPDIVRRWLDTCTRLGVPWHLWRSGNWGPEFAFALDYLTPRRPAVEPPQVPPPPVLSQGRVYTGPLSALPEPPSPGNDA